MGKRGTYTIHIGGEDRSGRFSLGFWELLQEEYGEPAGFLMSFLDQITPKELISLVYCSLKYDALANRKTFPYTRYEVAEWIEEVQAEDGGEEAISEVVSAFLDSRQVGKMIEAAEKIVAEIEAQKGKQANPEEIKKKQGN